MGNARAVLRGVTCKDTRDTLEELVDQGWKPEHSRGGHIKLTHEDAAHPIISAKTPSTSRGRLNLKSEAKRAIKMGRNDILSTTLLHSAIPPIEPANLEGFPVAPSVRMKKRWSKERRAAERASQEIVLPVYATRPVELASTLPSALGRIVAPAKTPQKKTAPTAPVEETAPAVAAEAVVVDAVAVEPNAGKDPAKNRKYTTAAKSKTKVARVAAPSAAAPVEAPAATDDVPVIGADVLAIAMRILSGDLRTVRITADMVGKTLIHEGEVHLVEGVLPAMVAPTMPAKAEVAEKLRQPTRRAGDSATTEMRRNLVRTALGIDPKAWLTHVELADLIADEAGYATRKSLLGCLRSLLVTMCRDGALEVRRIGAVESYRLAKR